jgi:hypothetical protein
MVDEKLELDFSKPEKKKKRPEGILVVRASKEKADRVLADGGIETVFFIESHSDTKDTAAEALQQTILHDLRNERDIAVREVKFHPVVEQEKIYSGFVEVDFVSKDFRTLIYLTLRYGPAAIEISHPDSITMGRAEMQNTLADISAAVQGFTVKILGLMTQEQRSKTLREGLDM